MVFIFCVIPQHFVFFVMRLIDMMVPDIPQALEIIIKREAYVAKQALADHHSLGGQSGGESGEDMMEDELP